MIILGLGAPFLHDSAAALLVDGKIAAAVEEERFSRNKHAIRALPIAAAHYCLEVAGVQPSDVQVVAFPWSAESYRRQRWRYIRRCLRGRTSRAWKALTRGRAESRERERRVAETLRAVGIDPAGVEVVYVDHHQAHASSCYHLSGFKDAAIMSIDGAGEFTSTLLAEGVDGEIRTLFEVVEPDSLGFFYATVTEYLGFERNDGEYKVMGMASYGDASKVDIRPLIRRHGAGFRVGDDYVWALRRHRHRVDKRYSSRLVELWGPPREGDELDEASVHIAAATQRALEEIVIGLMETHLSQALERRGGRLCLAGGCALNVAMNQKLLAHPLVNQLFVQPAAHDAGTPLGAATWAAVQRGETVQPMTHCYLGPAYGEPEIRALLERRSTPYERQQDPVELASALLEQGEVVAWFQGRMEFGPRALGNRSILAHPAKPGVADQVNQIIKFREKWRPFCPSLLASAGPDILGSDHASPFMALAFDISEAWRKRIPEVVHVDGTGRPQTVSQEQNPLFYRLLKRFEERTGLPVLLNTSLNRRGEPMVCSPDDALDMFYGSGLEHLFLGAFYIRK